MAPRRSKLGQIPLPTQPPSFTQTPSLAATAKILNLGGSLSLYPVSSLASLLCCTTREASSFLRSLSVPLAYIGKHRYFMRASLLLALYSVLRPGGGGYAAPNAPCRRSGHVPKGVSTAVNVLSLTVAQQETLFKQVIALSRDGRETARAGILSALAEAARNLPTPGPTKADSLPACSPDIAPDDDPAPSEAPPPPAPVPHPADPGDLDSGPPLDGADHSMEAL
jgi:hypothetical protein